MAFPNAVNTTITILETGGLITLSIGLVVIFARRVKARRQHHVDAREAQSEYTQILRDAGWNVTEASNNEVSSAVPPGAIDRRTASYKK